LAAFGVYNLVAARYRTVRGPKIDNALRAASLKIKGYSPR
jgi:hypothetical protein